MICAICQDDLLEDVHKLPCGHAFHKDCIIDNAFHGNLLCCVCRESPIKNASFDSIRQNAAISYDEQNRRGQEKAFRIGLRHGRNNKGSRKLIQLVRVYDTMIQKQKEATALHKLKVEAFRTMKKDIQNAVDKVMSLKRNKDILSKFRVKQLAKVRIHPTFRMWKSKFTKNMIMRRFKHTIAEAAGFQPLELL